VVVLKLKLLAVVPVFNAVPFKRVVKVKEVRLAKVMGPVLARLSGKLKLPSRE
jgi:hypothetical protein